jgi:carbonic anhydrase
MSQHLCEALVIHCIDFRIQRSLNDYLESRFPGAYDRVSVAGGVKNMPVDLEQCEVSTRLHHPQKIVLIQHEDCGAYGGSAKLGDFDAEKAFQTEELEKAEQTLKNLYPGIIIIKIIVRLSGEILEV